MPSPGLDGRGTIGDTSYAIVSLDVADTISSVLIYLQRQGSPGTIRIGIQGVTQSSNSHGYVNDGTFQASVDMTGTSISTSASVQVFTFASPVSLAAGTYAVVFKNQSGTFDGSNRCITGIVMNVAANQYINLIGASNTSSTSAGGAVQSYGSMRGALRTYGFPYATFTSISTTTPAQVGNMITLTSQSAASYDVSGVITRTIPTATGGFIKLYDDTLTEIGSVSLPNNSGATQRVAEYYFTAPITIYPNRAYYVVLSGTGQSNYYTLLQASDNTAFTAHDFQYCNRASSSGAFTLTPTRVMEMGFIIESQVNGGMIVHPGMTGGVHG